MSEETPNLRPATLAVHGGRRPTPEDPDIAPPLRRSTTFLQHPGTYAATDAGDWETPLVYTRYKNPNVEDAEARLAVLEGAERGVLFASGMAAIHAVFQAALPKGRGCIAVAKQIYGGTTALVGGPLADFGVETVPFDVTSESDLAEALDKGAKLVHVEGLSNPVAIVADLPRIAKQAHAHGALLSVDSTFATPIVQQPIALGADFVVHSATKGLSGHSDLTAGAVLGTHRAMEPILHMRKIAGAIMDPAVAWLLVRSIATVDLRVRAQCCAAMQISTELAKAPGVVRVHYPGLASSPSHELAQRVLKDGLFGSVFAFELEGGDTVTRPYLSRLRLGIDAPSLGGVETLVSLPWAMSHAMMSPEERVAAGIGEGCVRVATGIEDPGDLVADFLQAIR